VVAELHFDKIDSGIYDILYYIVMSLYTLFFQFYGYYSFSSHILRITKPTEKCKKNDLLFTKIIKLIF
jgi:hypothetical protein